MMNLQHILERATSPLPWVSGEKIPWNDPEFSRRMLKNHLSQEHDWASRRSAVIDRQTAWITAELGERPARVLDLGCGPGFYTERLARQGHHCVGVDFSPASIEYAREQAVAQGLAIDYVLEDIRHYQPDGKFDLVMLLFSEFNVFTGEDAVGLLAKAAQALNDNGLLIVEVSTFAAVAAQGKQPQTWLVEREGLFSERPHLYLQEHFWDEKSATATTRYTIVDLASATVSEYGASMKAYDDEQYRRMFADAGLAQIAEIGREQWPVGEVFADKLMTYVSRRAAFSAE